MKKKIFGVIIVVIIAILSCIPIMGMSAVHSVDKVAPRSGNVAQWQDGTYYANFYEAFNTAPDGTVIKLLADVVNIGLTNGINGVVNNLINDVPSANLTIDLNGFKLETRGSAGYPGIGARRGSLTIDDFSENKTGQLIAIAGDPNRGSTNGISAMNLTINAGTVKGIGNTDSILNNESSYGIEAYTMTINGGKVYASAGVANLRKAIKFVNFTAEDAILFCKKNDVYETKASVNGTLRELVEGENTNGTTIVVDAYIEMPPKSEVVFNSNGGSEVNSKKVVTGNAFIAPTAPQRDGYDFSGWYKDSSLSSQWRFDIDVVTEDITLFAKWSPIEYTITYDGEVKGENPTSYNINSALLALKPISKEGYIFSGWFTDRNLTNAITNIGGGTYGNLTLYPNFVPVKIKINFSESGINQMEVSYGNIVGKLPVPEKKGYKFLGWFTSEDGGTQITDSSIVNFTADTNLYAHWEKSKNTAIIIVLIIFIIILLLLIFYVVLYILWKRKDKCITFLDFLIPTFRAINKLLFKTELNDIEKENKLIEESKQSDEESDNNENKEN